MAPIDPLCRSTSGVDVSAARDAVTRLAVIARKNAGRHVPGCGECTARGIGGTVRKEAMQSIVTELGLRYEASSCYHCDSSQRMFFVEGGGCSFPLNFADLIFLEASRRAPYKPLAVRFSLASGLFRLREFSICSISRWGIDSALFIFKPFQRRNIRPRRELRSRNCV